VLKELADFDFSCVPSLNKQRVLELARGSYLDKAASIIMVGHPGLGKTHVATGLALAACRQGHRVDRGPGGDVAHMDHPDRLPQAKQVETAVAPRSGYVAGIDAMDVGLTAALLGGGQARKGEPIDHSVGVVLHAKVGDEVARGEPPCTVHVNSGEGLAEAMSQSPPTSSCVPRVGGLCSDGQFVPANNVPGGAVPLDG